MAIVGPIGQKGSVVLPFEFDHQKPDYLAVLRWRAEFLHRIRTTDSAQKLKAFYRANPAQFIADWGVIFEPRNADIGLPTKIPFVLYPRQVDWLDWTIERWRARERGVNIKSRGSGVSWLAVALGATLCLFEDGIKIGYGSRKAELVDQLGDSKSLFHKARMFLENLPPEFRGGWDDRKHSREMRLLFPETDSSMVGEAGDQIGRGDRTTLYFVDEAAFLEHPENIEGSLSDTTNCRIDVSTAPQDSTSSFWDRVDSLPERQVFTFSWHDDPRRTKEWEEKMRREVAPAVFAREFDMSRDQDGTYFLEESFLERTEDGTFIPVEWPQVIDTTFAVIDTALKSGKDHSGLGCVFYGTSRHQQTKYPLYVLDWEYLQLDGVYLETWLPTVFKRLSDLGTICKSRLGSAGAFIEDKASGIVLLQQAKQKGWPAQAIDSKLTSLGKTERAFNIASHVHQGRVKITKEAFRKAVSFKGITKNHFMAQVKGFRPGTDDKTDLDLLDCLSYGVVIALGNQKGF